MTRAILKPNVLSKTVHGEEVLLNLETGDYFCLNETGSYIWSKMKSTDDLEQISHEFAHHFEISTEEATSDVMEFVTALKNFQVLE